MSAVELHSPCRCGCLSLQQQYRNLQAPDDSRPTDAWESDWHRPYRRMAFDFNRLHAAAKSIPEVFCYFISNLSEVWSDIFLAFITCS